ncbi:MAG: pyridoxal-dependent decarboxylase, exosortase A system-associated [Proteobacteria bacterium]|nr:MAG: pyridoxal-dependent decarboxylase, exosortase A system-associated [Pseudomonadota bacterium]
MKQFPPVNGKIRISGMSIPELWELSGRVPFYVYDRRVIRDKVNQFRAHIPDKIKLHYAIKANPLPVLVNYTSSLVDGLDVASLKELRVALASGTTPENISFAGPAKSRADIAGAVAAGIIINAESETELDRIRACAEAAGKTAKIAIRVNPDFELKASGMKMGGGPKQFGIDAERVADIVRNLDTEFLEFVGYHIFSGSQNLKPESIIEAHNNTFELARRLVETSGRPITKLNIGGGFGIPYFPGENYLDLAPVSENLSQLLQHYSELAENTEIVIELGRYLVGESGLYICQVTDKKVSRNHTYLMCDGGLHHHLSNSGNFGQVIRKNYPVTIESNNSESGNGEPGEMETVTAVGPLCTPLDTLADKMELPKAEPGDFLVVFQSGAYGLSASPVDFLSHPHPVELFL